MKNIDKQIEKVWWIARNASATTVHYGVLDIGLELKSGQEVLEQFNNETDWVARLLVLSIIYNPNVGLMYWLNYDNDNLVSGELEEDESHKGIYVNIELFTLEVNLLNRIEVLQA